MNTSENNKRARILIVRLVYSIPILILGILTIIESIGFIASEGDSTSYFWFLMILTSVFGVLYFYFVALGMKPSLVGGYIAFCFQVLLLFFIAMYLLPEATRISILAKNCVHVLSISYVWGLILIFIFCTVKNDLQNKIELFEGDRRKFRSKTKPL